MPSLPNEAKCYGCGACRNICPTDAITFTYSNNGFLFYSINNDLCIECNTCVRSCPSINPRFDNEKFPEFWAYAANDEIRKVSSSGGAFTSIAKYVLSNNGIVCGAAWDNGLNLKHQFAINEEELSRFRGSKYMQSDTGLCFREIKKQLDRDIMVLFVGTPCQVAGLKGFLGKEYPYLITLDLLCHGVPSQLFFKAYVSEICREHGKQIDNIEFRSKKAAGWSYNKHLISFVDGTSFSTENYYSRFGKNKDPYMTAFLKNLMMRFTCYNCQFCNYPRQGDITIGDLWEAEKICPGSNDKKGTSFIFLNNERGKRLYKEIQEEAFYSKKIEIDEERYSQIPNRVSPKVWMNKGRRRFLNLVKNIPFSKAVSQSLTGHWDIGLLSVIYNDNIGSVLTYYAFYKKLTDMKYTVKQIERTTSSSLKTYEYAERFVKKWIPAYDVPIQFDSITDMYELNEMCTQFIVGSDQIFMENMSNLRGNIFFCQFVKSNKNIISYASSFGGPGARGGDEYYSKLKYFLNRFSFLSFREDDGVNFANNCLCLNHPAQWCLDPIFLCDTNHYLELINSYKRTDNTSYISAYIVKPIDRLAKLLKEAVSKLNISTVRCSIHRIDKSEKGEFDIYQCHDSFPIERTLSELYHAKIVITDSFHGVCLAIIFKKDFLCMPRDFEDRFYSLLKRIGLEDRIIANNMSNFSARSLESINYDMVYQKLRPLINESSLFLQNALSNKENIQYLTDYDVAFEYIIAQQNEISELKKEIENIKQQFIKQQLS